MESNLRRALSISQGELDVLWSSNISIGLWIMSGLLLILPIVRKYLFIKSNKLNRTAIIVSIGWLLLL